MVRKDLGGDRKVDGEEDDGACRRRHGTLSARHCGKKKETNIERKYQAKRERRRRKTKDAESR